MPVPWRNPLRCSLLALSLASCAGAPLAVREYVLTAVPPEAADGAAADGPVIGVGPIDLPGYLRRREIVTRTENGLLRTNKHEQWGESLAAGFGRVLAANLAREVPSSRVFVAPWRIGNEPAWQVSVQIQRFERDASGVVELEAGWVLRARECAGVGELRSASIHEPIDGTSPTATVEAHSRAVARLGREIAEAIRTAPHGEPCPR